LNEPDPKPTQQPSGDDTSRKSSLARRRFLNTIWKILGIGLVVEAGWTSYDILNPKASGAVGGVLNAGSPQDYPEGVVKYFLDGRFYITSSDGNLVALYQKCPHLGCRVPFCDSSGRFECPCHGSKYNIRGEYIEGPAPRGMDRFLIKVSGDRVLVDTATVVEGPPRGVSTVPSDAKGASCVGESSSGATGQSGAGSAGTSSGGVTS
jgi:Rieske Fe-S protein